MLRLLQLPEHLLEKGLPAGQVLHLGVPVAQLLSAALHIGGQAGQLGGFLPEGLHARRVRAEIGGAHPLDVLQPGAGQPVAPLHVHEEVEGHREHGHQHDQDDPGDLYGRVFRLVHNRQRHGQAQQRGHAVDDRAVQFPEPHKQQQHLGSQQEDHHCRPAKDQAEQAPLAFVQQQDGVLIQMGSLLFQHQGTSF